MGKTGRKRLRDAKGRFISTKDLAMVCKYSKKKKNTITPSHHHTAHPPSPLPSYIDHRQSKIILPSTVESVVFQSMQESLS